MPRTVTPCKLPPPKPSGLNNKRLPSRGKIQCPVVHRCVQGTIHISVSIGFSSQRSQVCYGGETAVYADAGDPETAELVEIIQEICSFARGAC